MTTTEAASPPGARARILDCALGLMSERGAAGTSMRRLAGACGLNVATIYHYFPSKADVLRAVIEERRYGERMAADAPPLDLSQPPVDRLSALLAWLWQGTLSEQSVLRLIIGEGLRGDSAAQGSARNLVAALDTGLTTWMAESFPDLNPALSPTIAARLVRRHLLALVAEHLATGSSDPTTATTDLAAVLFA